MLGPVALRFGFKLLGGVNSMPIPQYRSRNLQSCEVVFQREGHDVETLYWAGPMEEARELAREIAFKGGADTFRIIEFTGSDTEVMLWPALTSPEMPSV
jgi:hypothetical protein